MRVPSSTVCAAERSAVNDVGESPPLMTAVKPGVCVAIPIWWTSFADPASRTRPTPGFPRLGALS